MGKWSFWGNSIYIRTVINHTDPKMFSGLLNTDFICTLLWTWDPQLVGNKTRLETTCNVLAVLWSIFSNHLWLSLKAWLLLTKPIYPFHWLKNIFLMYSPGLKLTITFLSLTGLLIFRAVAEPWNSGISAKSREIHKNIKNTAKFGRNLIEYMSVQHIWNLFQLYGLFILLAVNLQIYLGTSWLKHANNIPKLPGADFVAKNWALAVMLKALPLVHFWSVLLLKDCKWWPLLEKR